MHQQLACPEHPGHLEITSKDFSLPSCVDAESTLLGTYGVIAGSRRGQHLLFTRRVPLFFLKLLVSLRMFWDDRDRRDPRNENVFPAFFASWITAALFFVFFASFQAGKFFATFPIIFYPLPLSCIRNCLRLRDGELAWEQSCNESWKQSPLSCDMILVFTASFLNTRSFVPQSLLQCDYKLNSFCKMSPLRVSKSSFLWIRHVFWEEKRVQNINWFAFWFSNVLLALCTRSSNSWSLGNIKKIPPFSLATCNCGFFLFPYLLWLDAALFFDIDDQHYGQMLSSREVIFVR